MPFAPRATASGERGAAAVEFALVVPLLLAIVLGVIGFGRAFSTQIDLSNSAQEAARFAVFAPTVPAPPSAAQVKDVAVAASSMGLASGEVSVSGSCSTAGSPVTVTATKPIYFDFVLGSFDRDVTGRAVMRCPG